MKALVTGAAGFIGSYTVKALVAQGCEVVGLDNINSYYDVQLKYDRLADTGITKESIEKDILLPSAKYPSYRFIKMDLTDREGLTNLFKDEHFDIVVNLAGQARCSLSMKILYAYIESEYCRFLKSVGMLSALSGKSFGLCKFKQHLWTE